MNLLKIFLFSSFFFSLNYLASTEEKKKLKIISDGQISVNPKSSTEDKKVAAPVNSTQNNTVNSKEKVDILEKYKLKDYRAVIEAYEKDPNAMQNDEISRVLAGISYRESNQNEKAVEALNFLSKNDKINQRVSLERAVACFKMRDEKCVLSEINKLESSGELPDQVKEFISNMKSNVGKMNQKIFYGSIGASFLYDSNPLLSSLQSSIILYGFNFNNTPSAPDIGVMSNALFGYNYKFDNGITIFGSSNLSYVGYQQTQTRNTFTTAISQGVSYRIKNITFSLPVSYNNLAIGSSTIGNPADLFLQYYSLSPSFEYKNSLDITFKSTFRFNQKFFTRQLNSRNSIVYMFDQAMYTNVGKYNTILYGSIGGGYEDAQDKLWTNYFGSASIAIRQYVPIKSILTYYELSYGLNALSYINYSDMLQTKRLDFYNSVKVSAHAILFNRIDMYISYIFERNISNSSLYDFWRQRVMTGFNLMF